MLFIETSNPGKFWIFILYFTEFKHLILKRNILLKSGHLKIAGFGLARILEAKSTNSFIGTPAYMSPEIWENKDYDFKSDVWYVFIIHDE